jgi:hypothetical protein
MELTSARTGPLRCHPGHQLLTSHGRRVTPSGRSAARPSGHGLPHTRRSQTERTGSGTPERRTGLEPALETSFRTDKTSCRSLSLVAIATSDSRRSATPLAEPAASPSRARTPTRGAASARSGCPSPTCTCRASSRPKGSLTIRTVKPGRDDILFGPSSRPKRNFTIRPAKTRGRDISLECKARYQHQGVTRRPETRSRSRPARPQQRVRVLATITALHRRGCLTPRKS